MLKVIRKSSQWRVLWDFLLIILIIISCFLIPIQVAFVHTVSAKSSKFLYLIDLYFVIDVILNFFTSYKQGGVEVKNRKQIAQHYLKTFFVVDTIASFPIDGLFWGFSSIEWKGISIILLLRLCRLLRIVTLYNTFRSWELENWSNAGLLRSIKYALTILLLIHWVACIWFLTAFLDGFPADSWVTNLGLAGASPTEQYLRSLYWAVTTMTTVGYGDITPGRPIEYILAIIVMLMGASIYAFIIGNIASLFSNFDSAKTAHQNRIDAITQYLRYQNISPTILAKVIDYYDYVWARHRDMGTKQLFQDIPDSFRLEIMQQITQDLLAKVPLFQLSPQPLKGVLLGALQLNTYPPDTLIATEGELATEICFISQGKVQISSTLNPDFTFTLNAGDYFGDLSIMLQEKRTGSVKTMEYCEIFTLSMQDFTLIKTKYPEFKEVLTKVSSRTKEVKMELLLEGIIL